MNYAVTHFLSMLLNLSFVWLLTTAWEVGELSSYFFVISVLTFISTFSNFGLPTIYLKAIKQKNQEQIKVIYLHILGLLMVGGITLPILFSYYPYIIYAIINSLLLFYQAETRARNESFNYSVAVIFPILLSIGYLVAFSDEASVEGLLSTSIFSLIIVIKLLVKAVGFIGLTKKSIQLTYKEGFVLFTNNIQSSAETAAVRYFLKITGNDVLLVAISIAQEYIQKISGIFLLYYKLILYPSLLDDMSRAKRAIKKQIYVMLIFILMSLLLALYLYDTYVYQLIFNDKVGLTALCLIILINGASSIKYLLLIDNVIFIQHKKTFYSQFVSILCFSMLIILGVYYLQGLIIATSTLMSLTAFIFVYNANSTIRINK